MKKTTSPHIRSTAANLLGFCLFVITSLHIANQVEGKLVDEITAVITCLLTVSCVLSFILIRTKYERRAIEL